jgi:hypothetical protein
MSHALVIKNANRDSFINYRSRVHSNSKATREVLPIIWLMEEAKQQGISALNTTPKIHCKFFEGNEGAIEIANSPKMRPRTQHLNIKYHHFRDEVRRGTISIYHTRTEDQIADIFTKPLPEPPFVKFREKMMGWLSQTHMEQLHCYIEMRECEHTCSGHSKIQPRAMYPSKYLGGIPADGP